MPTGYTHQIAEGCTFEEFIMSCARAFGALVTIRDDPKAEIPERFEPSDYYPNQIADLERELMELRGMPEDEAERRRGNEALDVKRRNREQRREKDALRAKYKTMLAKVEAWQPPSPNHVELRTFMVSQIRESIDWDCKVYEHEAPVANADTWRQMRIEEAERRLAYAQEEYAAEVKRVEARNLWLKQLRESIA